MGIVSTAIFTFESLVEIVARGLFMHPNAYLRSGWGILDFIVVLSG